MKKAVLFLAVLQIIFLCGCNRTRPVNAAADDSMESGDNDSFTAASADDSSAETTANNSSSENGETPAPGVKITDSRLMFSYFYDECPPLSDSTLVLRSPDTDSGTLKLVAVSLPDYTFQAEKTIPFQSSSNSDIHMKADQGTVLLFSDKQAIKLDFHLNILKSVNIAGHTIADSIVDVNGSLDRLLYYDDEGLKTADTNFQNTMLLLKHPQWSSDISKEKEGYLDGSFVDNDTKVFAYTDGNVDDREWTSSKLTVCDLKTGKTYTKSCVTDLNASCEMNIENTRQEFIYLDIQGKEPEYDLICFNDKNCSFTGKKICAIPEKKLVGQVKCPNAYVGLNSRYVVYTRLDDHNNLILCRYDRKSGKTGQRTFSSNAYDALKRELKFQPLLILPDGRVVIQFNDSKDVFLVDFQ